MTGSCGALACRPALVAVAFELTRKYESWDTGRKVRSNMETATNVKLIKIRGGFASYQSLPLLLRHGLFTGTGYSL